MSYDCYHSYPQLLQWKVLCLLVPKIPHTAVLTALEVADIFFRFCDWQVGHLGLFKGTCLCMWISFCNFFGSINPF